MRVPSVSQRIQHAVLKNYLGSDAFNGTTLHDLAHQLEASESLVTESVRRLVARGALTAIFGDVHPNSAIKAFPEESRDTQVEKFGSQKRKYMSVYPTRRQLRKHVNESDFVGRPFSFRLARGEPQLKFLAFDPAVLEIYRNDPRYIYRAPIVVGSTTISDEYYRSRAMPKHDQIVLKSFGLCFQARTHQHAIAAFLYDLSRLSAEHQNWWQKAALRGAYKIHPGYWDWACGYFPAGISVLEAITSELALINKCADVMRRPPLFRNEFEETPPDYGWLLRPTRREFDAFVHLLDKMLGENINEKFFRKDVSAETLEQRRHGIAIAKRKWKPRMLQEWFELKYTGSEKPWTDAIATFREVRDLRNEPAHTASANVYDKRLLQRQREVVWAAYQALRDIRAIFGTYSGTELVKLPRWLDHGFPIWQR
ncbi:MAG: hypothetical protein QOK37_1326 [Thermoanaerobaculia bacterium]|jgi:hypothetical protein|nr:hypothetical protein [Thermoanaerobaculia bacterium]